MGIFVFGKIPPESVVRINPLSLSVEAVKKITNKEKEMLKCNEQFFNDLSNLSNEEEWWFWHLFEKENNLLQLLNHLNSQFNINLNLKKVNLHLKVFQSVYDNKWWNSFSKGVKKEFSQNPISFFNGLLPLLRLAECMYIVNNNMGLADHIKSRLTNHREFESVSFELEVLSSFFQADLKVNPYPVIKSARVPEGELFCGKDKIYYEVTKRNILKSDLGKAKNAEISIYNWLHKRISQSIKGHIIVNSDSNLLIEKKKRLLNMFQNSIKSAEFFKFPYIIHSKEFNVCLTEGRPPLDFVIITVTEPSLETSLTTWISNSLFGGKTKQLSLENVNVLIADPSSLWDPKLFKYIIEEIKRQLRVRIKNNVDINSISAIIFYTIHFFSGGIKHIPHVFLLKKINPPEERLINAMRNALEKYPDWL